MRRFMTSSQLWISANGLAREPWSKGGHPCGQHSVHTRTSPQSCAPQPCGSEKVAPHANLFQLVLITAVPGLASLGGRELKLAPRAVHPRGLFGKDLLQRARQLIGGGGFLDRFTDAQALRLLL